jgi:hypothetical protein
VALAFQSISTFIIYLGRISYGLYLFRELIYFLVSYTCKAQLTGLSEILHLASWRGGMDTIFAFSASLSSWPTAPISSMSGLFSSSSATSLTCRQETKSSVDENG